MRINGETEIFECGHQQNEIKKEKLRRPCFEIFVKIPNNPEPEKVFYVISVGLKNRYKERDKRKKVEWHDGC